MGDSTMSLAELYGIRLIQIWNIIPAILSIIGTVVYNGLVLFTLLLMGPRTFFSADNLGITGICMLLLCIIIPLLFIASITALLAITQKSKCGYLAIKIQASLSLFIIPVGTVVGVLILKYIRQPQVRKYFDKECFFG